MRGGLVLATIPDPKNTLNKSPGDDTVAARDLSAERERAVPFGVRRVSKGRKQGAQYRRPPRQLRGGRLAHRHRSGAPAGSAAEAACRGQRTNGRGECVVRCGRAERHHANQQDPFAHHGYFVKMQAMRAISLLRTHELKSLSNAEQMPCKLLAALAAVCATASAFRVPCANFESVRTRGAGLALRSATCGAWSMSGSSGPGMLPTHMRRCTQIPVVMKGPSRNLWAVIHRRAAIVAGTAAAMGWSRVAVAAAVEDEEDDESSSGQGGAKITDRVYFDFKISGRTKALVNPKWEKLIARDKRASGFTDEEFSQVCHATPPNLFWSTRCPEAVRCCKYGPVSSVKGVRDGASCSWAPHRGWAAEATGAV